MKQQQAGDVKYGRNREVNVERSNSISSNSSTPQVDSATHSQVRCYTHALLTVNPQTGACDVLKPAYYFFVTWEPLKTGASATFQSATAKRYALDE